MAYYKRYKNKKSRVYQDYRTLGEGDEWERWAYGGCLGAGYE